MDYAAAVKQGLSGGSSTPSGFVNVPKQVKVDAPPGLDEPVDNMMWGDNDYSSDDFDMDGSQDSEELKVYGSGNKRYVKKGADVEDIKKEAAPEKPVKVQKKPTTAKSQLEIEFQNIRNLILAEYSGSLASLNAICNDINSSTLSQVNEKERRIKDELKRLSGAPKPVQKKENTFKERPRKGGKNATTKKVEPKKTSKVTLTITDEDGFILKQTVTAEDAKKIEKGELAPPEPVDEEIEVVEEKKSNKATKKQIISNNPFSAVLMAGSYTSVEEDMIKQQQKKASLVNKNKNKQRKAAQQQQQKINAQANSGSATQPKSKKNNSKKGKDTNQKVQQNNKQSGSNAQRTKNKNKPQNQNKTQKKQKKTAEDKAREAKSKRQSEKAKHEAAEAKRIAREKERIEASLRDVEQEKKLRKLVAKKKGKDEQWYENEYAQPAALVGACAVLLTLIYSFVLQQ
eukprot:TRINITY_DN9123_c0_g1_i1.p1 TRINITY_DN9123_c0_g1~~TRINITY_DN9123_c0_g1_i1.p1  ORF type:complete len:457 (+),score=166.53 TRINITY_DN9123_c0_g1_i1:49-1419(+)